MRTKEYHYKTPDLCKFLGVSRYTIILWERKGIFTAPRTVGNQRIFTERQFNEIKLAFDPGGKGYWHFNPKTGGGD